MSQHKRIQGIFTKVIFLAKKTAGLVEEITIIGPMGKELKYNAIFDSGATRTSIDISIAKKLELGPILGSVRVKSKTASSGYVRRLEVPCKIEIQGTTYDCVVNITDRRDMFTKALIGRNIIHENFIIDVSKTHTSPDIKDMKTKNNL